YAVLPAIVLVVCGPTIVGLYLDASDPANRDVIARAVTYLNVAAVFQVFDAVQAVAFGALRGLNDAKMPMALAAMSYWVWGFGAALLLAFALGLGGKGVWMGLAIGLGTASVLLSLRLRWRLRR
ncbi:MAG: MATE family efflux transporter, partial [Gammaproteobacteria bacterium]